MKNFLRQSSKSAKKSLVVLLLGLISCACNSSGNSSNNSQTAPADTGPNNVQTELTALQNQVNKLQESIAALQATNSSLEAELSADETKLGKIALLGHQLGTSTSYGPCSDMGVLLGSNQVDALTATIEDFRQCTGYEYGVVVENGTIAKPIELWFDGVNCTGNMFEAENDGGYNRQVLQNGVVFMSPVDGVTELMVSSGQTGSTTALQSNFSAGTCNSPANETQIAYSVSMNSLNITGVPSSVPADYIL